MFILEVLDISPDVLAKRGLLLLHKPAAPQFGKWYYYPPSCSIKSQECILDLSFSAMLFNPSISPLAFIFKLHLKLVSISLSSLILPWSKHHVSPDYNSQGDHFKK